MHNGKKYYLRNDGYYISTKEPKELLHRVIWEEYFGPIPDGYHIHHKDEDKTNNKIDNLELLSASDHHKTHRPCPDDGLTSSERFYKNHKDDECERARNYYREHQAERIEYKKRYLKEHYAEILAKNKEYKRKKRLNKC